MMFSFLGIDHGTSAVRFALIAEPFLSPEFPEPDTSENIVFFEIPRAEAGAMSPDALLKTVESSLGCSLKDVTMTAVTYSMGDGLSSFTDIRRVSGRGLEDSGGAGLSTGAGTKVYDMIKEKGGPAYVVPGLTRKSPTDRRLKIFSHQASPEKTGILYQAYALGFRNFVLSDIGSNTVTMAVADGRILGGLDACIFAPGRRHGPLDLDALRRVDHGLLSANDAFSASGVDDKIEDPGERAETIALFAAMEMISMSLLIREKGLSFDAIVSGSGGDDASVVEMIAAHLQMPVTNIGKRAAAVGCARIAKAVFIGKTDILGIPVDRPPE